PQHDGLGPGVVLPLDDRLAYPEGAFHGEQGLVLVRPDVHAVVLALGRDLEHGGLALGSVALVGHGRAAEDEENGEGNAAGVHASPPAWALCLTCGHPAGGPGTRPGPL